MKRAFTLIEMIGVLAVLAILAVIIVPNMIHQLDTVSGQQEAATLQGFGSALQSSICRNFYIPGQTDWASNIAAEVGMDMYDVATNSRGQQRAFLVDPSFWNISSNNLPYMQTIFGTNVLPLSPRVMILSSLSTNLPANVFGPISASDFGYMWNTADGSTPATSFSGWPGSNDLKIQRINLSSVFVQLMLSSSVPPNGQYQINNSGAQVIVVSGVTNAYYIQNSTLRLMNARPLSTVAADQILIQNSSFVYNANGWHSHL